MSFRRTLLQNEFRAIKISRWSFKHKILDKENFLSSMLPQICLLFNAELLFREIIKNFKILGWFQEFKFMLYYKMVLRNPKLLLKSKNKTNLSSCFLSKFSFKTIFNKYCTFANKICWNFATTKKNIDCFLWIFCNIKNMALTLTKDCSCLRLITKP